MIILNDKIDAIYLPYDFITPSQKHGIPAADELRLRNIAGEIITEAGYSLRLPWYATITAQAIFQRFYYRYSLLRIIIDSFRRVSFLDYDIKESIMACIFVAAKIEECSRKLRDIVTVCYHVFKVTFFSLVNIDVFICF